MTRSYHQTKLWQRSCGMRWKDKTQHFNRDLIQMLSHSDESEGRDVCEKALIDNVFMGFCFYSLCSNVLELPAARKICTKCKLVSRNNKLWHQKCLELNWSHKNIFFPHWLFNWLLFQIFCCCGGKDVKCIQIKRIIFSSMIKNRANLFSCGLEGAQCCSDSRHQISQSTV